MRQAKIKNGKVEFLLTAKELQDGFTEIQEIVRVGDVKNGDNFETPALSLEEKKDVLVSVIEKKMTELIVYLKKSYEQSSELGTIDDIKRELEYFATDAKYSTIKNKKNREKYEAEIYPANSVYAKTKSRTLIEQIERARYKRELTHLASAKVESFKSIIKNIATEEEYASVKVDVDYIESLGTVREFMQFMGV